MKLLIHLVGLIGLLCVSVSGADNSVVALEVRGPAKCINGVCGDRITLWGGSAVTIDAGELKLNKKNVLVFLTAMHCVTATVTNPVSGQEQITRLTLTQTVELYINGQWIVAKVGHLSKSGDIALLFVTTDEELPLICLAPERAAVGDKVAVAGFVQGNDYHSYAGKVLEHDVKDMLSPNCDAVKLPRDSVVSGQSGGAVLDSNGDLVGIITSRNTQVAGVAYYTHLSEIRRFLGAAWDKEFDGGEKHQRTPMPGRMQPRLGPDDETPEKPKAPPEVLVPKPDVGMAPKPPTKPLEGTSPAPEPYVRSPDLGPSVGHVEPQKPIVESGPPKGPILIYEEPKAPAVPRMAAPQVGSSLPRFPVIIERGLPGTESAPRGPPVGGVLDKVEGAALKAAPLVVAGLSASGLVTGGAGTLLGLGVGAVSYLVTRKRNARHAQQTTPQVAQSPQSPQSGGAGPVTFPAAVSQPSIVPRDLGQASEILQLAKREIGYSPLLAEYTGLVVSDVIKNRIEAETNPLVKDALHLLQETINRKVSEDCPLTSNPTVFK